jgi:hypothetical protein
MSYSDAEVHAMLRVAFKAGVQSGFDWLQKVPTYGDNGTKLTLAEMHKEQLYENWATTNAEAAEKDCECPDKVSHLCVNILCPRRSR